MRLDNTRFQLFIEYTQTFPVISSAVGVVRIVANSLAMTHNLAMAIIFKDRKSYYSLLVAGKHYSMLRLNFLEIKRGFLQLLPIIGAIWLEAFNHNFWNVEEINLKRYINGCDIGIAFSRSAWKYLLRNIRKALQ